jgi:UDP-N-acetylmuramate dehydrogenase
VSVAGAFERLSGVVSGSVKRGEPLARHTTYRIGGPAALYVECESVADVAATIDTLVDEEVEYTILGKGSNVLASDAGYPGAIVVLGREFKRHAVEDSGSVISGAGVILGQLVQAAFAQGLTGMEFAVGIPGTLGGALAMNAGTRDDWIGSRVERLTLHCPGVGLVSVRGPEVSWGYRHTDLARRGVILEAGLRLTPGDTAQIRRVMEAALRRRKRSQPLGMPNAGSVFVNPTGDSAGRLIESVGLKGMRVGDAMVSEVHANFIVNAGAARAADVVELIKLIRERVEEAHGIRLRPEVRFLGPFDA